MLSIIIENNKIEFSFGKLFSLLEREYYIECESNAEIILNSMCMKATFKILKSEFNRLKEPHRRIIYCIITPLNTVALSK